MPDGGEELLTGVIAGSLSQLINVSFPIKIKAVSVLIDPDGNYRRVVEVEMASGTYYVSITDHDPGNVIKEEP